MNRPLFMLAAAALTASALVGCGRKEVDTSMTSGTPSAGAASAVTPAQATDPVPAQTGTGPSDGSTAIGGLSGDKNAGGGGSSGGAKPAPTGGDGAASK